MIRAGSSMSLQRASTLPKDDEELFYAARQPGLHDFENPRTCCGGMWNTKQTVGFILGLASMIVFSFWTPVTDYPRANPMFGITLLCGFFWLFEVIPVYITALLPIVLIPLYGISSTQIVAQAYWNEVQLLVVGTYMLGLAVEQTQLTKRFAIWILLHTGAIGPTKILGSFMLLTFLLSMICNSIAVTLVVTSFAISLLNAEEEKVRNVLPLVSEDSDSDSSSDSDEEEGESSLQAVQKFADGILLGIAYAASCGGMTSLTGAIPNEVVTGIPNIAEVLTFGKWMLYALPTAIASLVASFLVLYVRYLWGLKLPTLTDDALQIEKEEFERDYGERMGRDEVLVLLLQIIQLVLLFLKPVLDKLDATEYGEALMGDATLAALPVIFLFIIPSARYAGRPLLPWATVHAKFDFGLILLIGGAFAIADGFMQSGLNIALGQGIAGWTKTQTSFWLTCSMVGLCTVFTQVFSAVGTAGTILPALNSAALNSLRNPLSMLLPATVACSFAFCLPTAMPSNIVVFAKSQDLPRALRVRDFFWSGLPTTIIVVIVSTWILWCMEGTVYNTRGPFPQWACDGVSCLWVNVPGTTGYEDFQSQACIPNTELTMCRLANGTVVAVGETNIVPI